MEKFKGILDYFNSAIGVLRGVGSSIKFWTICIIFSFVLLWTIVATVLEAIKKVKDKHEGLMTAENKYPRFFGFLYGGKVRFFLLIVVIILFSLDWRDLMTVTPPIINMPNFPAPIIQYPAPQLNAGAAKGPAWTWEPEPGNNQCATALITAHTLLENMSFRVRCSAHCKEGGTLQSQAMGTGTGTWIDSSATSDPTVVKVRVLTPSRLTPGQQIALAFCDPDPMIATNPTVELSIKEVSLEPKPRQP